MRSWKLNSLKQIWIGWRTPIWTDWGVQVAKRDRKDLSDLPELTEPNVKWSRVGNNSPRIKAVFRKPDGRTGYISKPVPVELIQDEELVAKLTAGVEKAVQAEYNEKHTPKRDESEASVPKQDESEASVPPM